MKSGSLIVFGCIEVLNQVLFFFWQHLLTVLSDMYNLVLDFETLLPDDITYIIFGDSAFGGLDVSVKLMETDNRFVTSLYLCIFNKIGVFCLAARQIGLLKFLLTTCTK